VCQKNKSDLDSKLGVVPCLKCRERQRRLPKAGEQVEWTSDEIKEMRRAHADDILQPYRAGELSKEYVDKYGTKSIKASKSEVKKANYTWQEDKYYKEHK